MILSGGEKLKLFVNLFLAKTENFVTFYQKDGKEKQIPAYQVDWKDYQKYKESGGSFATYLNKKPKLLTPKEIALHLSGEQKIGVYPIIDNESSYFSTLNIKKDFHLILNLLNLANKENINLYITSTENSYILWLFLEKKLDYKISYTFWQKILEFIQKSTNQDIFPENFVITPKDKDDIQVLPLCGKYYQDQQFLFVDTNFKPYTDQFDLIKNIKKNSINEIIKFIQKFTYSTNESIQITLSNNIKINKNSLPNSVISYLQSNLIIPNSAYTYQKKVGITNLNIPKNFVLVQDSFGYLILPKGFFNKFINFLNYSQHDYKVIDIRIKVPIKEIRNNIILKEFQKRAVNKVLRTTQGILKAPPGSGKTVMALYICTYLKQKTLIIVHRKQLLQQWLERINSFLEVEKNDIGEISSKKKIIGEFLTIATIQSLNKIKIEDLEKTFGLVIVDECHHTPATTFTNIISKLQSYYLYGLTATPIRKYSDESLIFAYLGDILAEVSTEEKLQQSDSKLELIIRQTNLIIPFSPKDTELESLVKILIFDSDRNLQITKDVLYEVKQQKKILILTERVEHLEILHKYLREHTEVIFVSGQDSHRGKINKLKKIEKNEFQVLISTGQFFGEGMDFPNLDVLFLVFPFSFEGKLIQYIGRIQRSTTQKIIYDYSDNNVSYFSSMFKKRYKYYKTLNLKQAKII